MRGCGLRETEAGDIPAVGPKISGQARIAGTASGSLDATEPFPGGFTLGDIR